MQRLLFAPLALATMQPALTMQQTLAMQAHNNEQLRKYFNLESIEKVQKYLDKGASPNLESCRVDPYLGIRTQSLLEIAIWRKNSEIACLFIDKGANPNSCLKREAQCCSRDSYGPPVLLIAAQNNLTEVCKKLLEKGADAHAEHEGENALTWARKNNNWELEKLLRDTYNAQPVIPKKKKCCLSSCSLQ